VTTIAVRSATSDDAEAIATLLAEVASPPIYTAAELEDDLASYPGQDAWVVEDADGLAGWAALRPRGALLADCAVAVRPGTEDALVDLLERRAGELGFPILRLCPRGPYEGLEARGFARERTFLRLRADGPMHADGPAEIREVDPLDPALHAIEQEGFAAHWGFVPETYAAWCARVRRDLDARGVAAYLDGTPVGAARTATRHSWHWIGSLVVAPTARDRGIGAQLTVGAAADARPVGLEVDAENAAALALYRSLGFVEIGERTFWEKTL
jgi:N-acetylglutamate synthase-like GNAT family acetyltransferase